MALLDTYIQPDQQGVLFPHPLRHTTSARRTWSASVLHAITSLAWRRIMFLTGVNLYKEWRLNCQRLVVRVAVKNMYSSCFTSRLGEGYS